MLNNKEDLCIEYLGSDNIQLSSYEHKLCNFYLIKNNKHRDKNYTISNNDYFILKDLKRIKENKNIFYEECEIVVIGDELTIDEEVFKHRSKKIIDEKIKENFLYSLALYYLRNEEIENGQEVINELGDIYIYKLLDKDLNIEEKNKIINILKLCIEDNKFRFKEGKLNLRKKIIVNENECLIEILSEILNDQESKLLWDYRYDYIRGTSKNNMIEDNYIFIKPKSGYGEVVDIVIGNKKLNVCVKVKVEGEVENKETNLKLSAHVFREFIIVLNGRLNINFIWCKLSKKLKSKYKKRKLIKEINNIYGEEFITLDLTHLEISNNKLLRSLDIEGIAKDLYEIEELKIRQGILKNIIKDRYIKENEENKSLDIIKETLIKYRVDQNGLYHPIGIKKSITEKDFQVYLARVFEWKLEKYPRKEIENEILKEYEELIDDKGLISFQIIYNEYKNIKVKQKKLEYRVNIVRISSAILKKEIFIWDEKYEKEKKENDNVLGINAIVGGKMKVFTKVINNINIRQDSYNVIIRCD